MRAKKSLGQNFLKSKPALAAIRDASDVNALDVILEVGPGKGALTETLLTLAGKVIAVEKDEALVALLQEKFAAEIAAGKLDLRAGDIMEFDPELMRFYTNDGLVYKIAANIPYYITGIFIRKFLTASLQPERMVLLVQKEVAKRIVANDKKESLLSLSVKAYGTPRYVETVQAKYFSPAPNVDSAIISIENISRDFFSDLSEESFFKAIKAGFAHKRKQLAGNLREVYSREAVEQAFKTTQLDEKIRAEDIPLDVWKKIALALG